MDNEVIYRPGYEALWLWFGLSYSSWVTMPRAFMHEMPDEWQQRMAELLNEWSETWNWPDDTGDSYVIRRFEGKFASWPGYIQNYRHPDSDFIKSLMRSKDGQ